MAHREILQLPDPVDEFVQLTLRQFELARKAAAHAEGCLSEHAGAACRTVSDCEKELDRIDRDIDERVTEAIAQTRADQVRLLLACMKLSIDLERIGDLLAAYASRAQVLGARLGKQEREELVKMAAVLKRMLDDAGQAFSRRDLDGAIRMIEADAELDRLHNLVTLRHLQMDTGQTRDSIHVLAMAQSLERAGDHCKNLGEEISHLITGHSARHALRRRKQLSSEEMYLQRLRERHPPRR